MSEESYVEKLTAQAASYILSNELVVRARVWRVIDIPLGVEDVVEAEHARSLDDPETILLLRQGGPALGFNPNSIRNGVWFGSFFCKGLDAHGPDGRMLWSQIAAFVRTSLRFDEPYREVRDLSYIRERTRRDILHRQAMKYAPP